MDFLRNSGQNEETTDDINDSENTLLEDIDALDICYMSVSYFDQKCGSTLYYPISGRIEIVNQIEDNDLDSVVALVLQTRPHHVIINAKSDLKLIDILKGGAKQSVDSKDSTDQSKRESTQPSGPESSGTEATGPEESESDMVWKMESRFELHIVSHTLFAYENCKNRILSLNFTNRSFADENEKFLYISSILEFSDNNTFRSFGALLRFLDNHLIDIRTETMATTVEVSSISHHYLDQLVTIERNTYESLQIFQQEWHPSTTKQGINQKEGISLFGLFNRCVSKLGANYLRKMFLLPLRVEEIITDRLNTIEFFNNVRNHCLRDNLLQHLKRIKGVNAIFNRIRTNTFAVNDLQTLYHNLMNALKIRDLIGPQRTGLKSFEQIQDSFDIEMDELIQLINKIIDFEKSIKSQSFEVNAGVNEELDQAKYVFGQLPSMLEETAQQELKTFKTVRQCNCVYLPQIGFLTSVHIGQQSKLPHESEAGLQFMIQLGDSAYYKTDRTKQLDYMFGDIQSEITDRQIQIVIHLKELIWKKRYLFIIIAISCAKLDALIAMSRTALDYRYVRPELTTDDIIEIVDGRHPLIELMFTVFVPNDYRSGGQYKKSKLLSGPNACGKSVYLKMICLITYLAHIGSFVPAVSARIPIIDRIFTRIQSPESVSTRLSTFMIDLKQMSNATKNATNRSLVVIDEFGKGTQPVDGLALMASSLNHLMMDRHRSPHLVVSSHFKRLPSLLDEIDSVDCLTFDINRNGNQIDYLYKLIAGHSTDSIATHIAYLSAIPTEIIEKGKKICESIANNEAIDCFDDRDMNFNQNYEEIGKNFLELNIESDADVYRFFSQYFPQSFRSASEE